MLSDQLWGAGQCLVSPFPKLLAGMQVLVGAVGAAVMWQRSQNQLWLQEGSVRALGASGRPCCLGEAAQHCPWLPAERILVLPVSLATQSHKHQVVGARRDRGIGQI